MAEQVKGQGQQTKKEDSYKDAAKTLEARRRQLEKEAAKLKAHCDHRSKKGSLKISPIKGSKVICDKCNETFDLSIIDNDTLSSAVEVVHNAIQQVRCMTGDKERDQDLLVVYGEMDYNLKNLANVYAKLKSKAGQKEKQHKNNDDGLGYYRKSTSFISKK